HIPNVIAAFSNSKLRMQVTQVHLIHVRGDSLRAPGEGTGTPGSPDEAMPGKPIGGPLGVPGGGGRGSDEGGGDIVGGAARPLPGGAIGIGGVGGTGAFPGTGSGLFPAPADEEVGNLVEMTVYAIASLYEKFPAKPDAPASGTASSGVGAPAK